MMGRIYQLFLLVWCTSCDD